MRNPPEITNWHNLDTAEALRRLDTDAAYGLTDAQAADRWAQHGPNELVERVGRSSWAILLDQLTGIMVVMLVIAAVVSAVLGDHEDAVVIMIIVALNAMLGFSQEYRAEKAMAALKKLAVPAVRVRREGQVKEIPAPELVPGDIILIEAGNLVAADCRLVESVNLRIQESALTGESAAAEKHVRALDQPDVPLGDRRNMAYKGTAATYGRGLAVVTETGMRTELGRIAEMLQAVVRESTPLQRRLEQLARGLAAAALVLVGVIFFLGILRGEPVRLMFMTALSLAVAAVPEALPAVVTIALALGAQRMLKRRALIRKLPAVETLGSVTVICSDKTGTLTENRMTVTVLDAAGHRLDLTEHLHRREPVVEPGEEWPDPLAGRPPLRLLLAASALCNDAVLSPDGAAPGDFHAVGDPTEGALVVAAARLGLWKAELDRALPRVAEVPFDSERKRMTTVHHVGNGADQIAFLAGLLPADGFSNVGFTKGAVDSLLEETWIPLSRTLFSLAWWA